ncbi:MAG: VPEID-CTERM sorting domain-containing protein [Rhodobacteraceae bacterium]|nr:VPEID-CTERM sorting domain-containing protein [Paracoccaceae bacterium]
MNRITKGLIVGLPVAITTAIAAVPVAAQQASCSMWSWWSCPPTVSPWPDTGYGGGASSVPEIDASTSLLAVAALLAVVVFVWDRNRRRAS